MVRKKKRAAPHKKCENCGKNYHPAKRSCPHCGVPNPVWLIKRKDVKTLKGNSELTVAHLIKAAKLIDQFDTAEQAIEAIKACVQIRSAS
jgi:ribosomal protein L37E